MALYLVLDIGSSALKEVKPEPRGVLERMPVLPDLLEASSPHSTRSVPCQGRVCPGVAFLQPTALCCPVCRLSRNSWFLAYLHTDVACVGGKNTPLIFYSPPIRTVIFREAQIQQCWRALISSLDSSESSTGVNRSSISDWWAVKMQVLVSHLTSRGYSVMLDFRHVPVLASAL